MIFRLISSFSRVSVLILEHSYLKLTLREKIKKLQFKFLDQVIENLKLKCEGFFRKLFP